MTPGGSSTDNNSNLLRQENYISGSSFFQDNFTYDSLNRLTSIAEKLNGTGADSFKQAYIYDRWGNRTIDQTNTWGTGIPKPNFGVDASTNRLTPPAGYSMTYDNVGNLTNYTYTGAGTRVYDAENRMIGAQASSPASYTYDGDSHRIKRIANGIETWQVYGLGGELLAEYAANADESNPQKEYGYRNGELLITTDAPVTPTNVALATNGGVATASSSYTSTPTEDDSPATTNNGDRTGKVGSIPSVWNSAPPGHTFDDWLQVDFNGSKTIGEIDVFTIQDNWQNPSEPTESMTFATYGITSYDVQFWTGSAWQTVPGGSVSGNNKVWRKFTFAAVTTTKIRVLIHAAGDGYSRVAELEAWTASSAAQVHWLVTDHLGTPRMVFEQSGSLAAVSRHDYLPFGEELFAGTGGRTTAQGYTSSDNLRQKFTSKERDIETGLDYFLARYYGSTQGRFTSPDDFLNDTHVLDPASWNLYTYVRNNPLRFSDPTGEVVNGAGLTDRERQQLINDWKRKTGYVDVYFDANNNLTINRDAGIAIGPDGKYRGSADARANLTDAIETKDTFNLEHANDSDQVAFADNELSLVTTNAQTNVTTRTYRVRIDFSDFSNVTGDPEAIAANSIGLVTLHEFDHKLYGNIQDTPNGPNDPGPVETNYINPIRQQLGLAQRATYSAVPVGGALREAYRGYVQVRYTLSGRDRMLRWRDTVVGGVHR